MTVLCLITKIFGENMFAVKKRANPFLAKPFISFYDNKFAASYLTKQLITPQK